MPKSMFICLSTNVYALFSSSFFVCVCGGGGGGGVYISKYGVYFNLTHSLHDNCSLSSH